LKKKGLEAVLAELGYIQREPCGHDDSHDNIMLYIFVKKFLLFTSAK